jgi:hypothetical protein
MLIWLLRSVCRAAAYPFFYIKPGEDPNDKIVKKFNKNKVSMRHFHPIGTFFFWKYRLLLSRLKRYKELSAYIYCPRMQGTLQ